MTPQTHVHTHVAYLNKTEWVYCDLSPFHPGIILLTEFILSGEEEINLSDLEMPGPGYHFIDS